MAPSLIPDLLQLALERVEPTTPIWLVGGALRDYFLQIETFDFDLACAGDSLGLARSLADEWGGAYYTLDRARQTGRALLRISGAEVRIDIAKVAEGGILADLVRRDFTVNALAARTDDHTELIDPAGGLQDLKEGVLRACAPDAIEQDPLRSLRAVRLAAQLGFRIEKATMSQARAAAGSLGRVSGERRRDELFRILELDHPGSPLRILNHLGLLERAFLPDRAPGWLQAESGVVLVETIVEILDLLARQHDSDGPARLVLAEASLKLGRYRSRLIDHFSDRLAGDRSRRELLILAALVSVHSVNEPSPSSPAWPLAERLERVMRLSRREGDYLQAIQSAVTRLSGFQDREPSTVEVYRYFRDLGLDGVDAALLWLAQGLAEPLGAPGHQKGIERLDSVRTLLAAMYESDRVNLAAPDLIKGDDLIRELGVQPGPIVGQLLAEVREAHAIGAISTRDQALGLAEKRLQ